MHVRSRRFTHAVGRGRTRVGAVAAETQAHPARSAAAARIATATGAPPLVQLLLRLFCTRRQGATDALDSRRSPLGRRFLFFTAWSPDPESFWPASASGRNLPRRRAGCRWRAGEDVGESTPWPACNGAYAHRAAARGCRRYAVQPEWSGAARCHSGRVLPGDGRKSVFSRGAISPSRRREPSVRLGWDLSHRAQGRRTGGAAKRAARGRATAGTTQRPHAEDPRDCRDHWAIVRL